MKKKDTSTREASRNRRTRAPKDHPPTCAADPVDTPGGDLEGQALLIPDVSTEKTHRNTKRPPREATIIEVEPNRVEVGVARSGETGGGCQPALPDELKKDVTLIREDIVELGALANNAVDRKLLLGEHLHAARGKCQRGQWTHFLDRCGLSDRTAREAIAFYRNRDAINELKRHGRAGLVTDIRLAIAKPEESRPVERGRGHDSDVKDAEREECPDDEEYPDDDDGTPPDDDAKATDVADDDSEEAPAKRFLRWCKHLVDDSDSAIAMLKSGVRNRTFGGFKVHVPRALAKLRRVGAYLEEIEWALEEDE